MKDMVHGVLRWEYKFGPQTLPTWEEELFDLQCFILHHFALGAEDDASHKKQGA